MCIAQKTMSLKAVFKHFYGFRTHNVPSVSNTRSSHHHTHHRVTTLYMLKCMHNTRACKSEGDEQVRSSTP